MIYKDLIVWQKAHSLTIKIVNVAESTKRSIARDIITNQLLRAVTSIGANIAEGYGRHEGKEYSRFLQIAYGSANEVDNWLTVLRDSELIKNEIATDLLRDNEEILKMLATMIRKIKGGGLKVEGRGETIC